MSPDRNGNFTSSEIFKLMTNGKSAGSLGAPALTYIEECNWERMLGRALEDDVNARPLSWGKLLEKRGFDSISLDYQLCSSKTLSHPEISYWKGSPDAIKEKEVKTVADLKCPVTLRSFCQLMAPAMDKGKLIHEAGTIEAVRWNHKAGDQYFWQIVSNAILTGATSGELIVYVPYLDELEDIREMARQYDGDKQYRFMWINSAADDELPHLIKGQHYKNVNIIQFDILERDTEALRKRVLECGEYLIKRP